MNLSSKTVASLLFTLGLGVVSTGCIIEEEGTLVTTTTTDALPAEILIDTDATLVSKPGDGVGVFVEYASGGRWNVFTTCDTNISGAPCTFDVLISSEPGVVLANVRGTDLDDADRIQLESDGSIRFMTRTSNA